MGESTTDRPMLRSFVQQPQTKNILRELDVFDIPEKDSNSFSILRFELLTPDSFVWRLLIGKHVYYLYAEDFVSGLKYIIDTMAAYMDSTDFELVKVHEKYRLTFEQASPVKNAYVYDKSDDADEMMQYAAASGCDFVFLAKSTEKSDDAYFSDEAPRGFNR